MYKNKKICLVIPVYNEEDHIEEVIKEIPEFIDFIIVIDDKSTDNTLKILKNIKEERLHIIVHETNQGVGKSTVNGFLLGEELGADIFVRIDGDGQMKAELLPKFLDPLIDEDYDFAKGNRMSNKKLREQMPKYRFIGNKILTWITKITTGYWNVNDAQNGYTAMKKETFKKIRHEKLNAGYTFENSMLFELSLINAKIKEIEMKAIYQNESSSIKLRNFIPSMILYQLSLIPRRIFYKMKNVFN
ncbi:MAG: glycosyltransferase family 2 protein [Candidatus Heimdallarchaeum aukensis]|uniref:Glycosyltransferase family 2 protein n=1 Tax=Candidatus Heimdallarchaeum aukensis TaxID=2876573 RepID=A0A9Y1FM54_9ARCH|nr:MAG: glycosyltransferase family 2 protein [Candidatus Heimdallarchaeum aukensis]